MSLTRYLIKQYTGLVMLKSRPNFKPKTCSVCAVEFTPTTGSALTCGLECANKWFKFYTSPNCICTGCQVPFRRNPANLKRMIDKGTTELFCTRACRDSYLRSNRFGERMFSTKGNDSKMNNYKRAPRGFGHKYRTEHQYIVANHFGLETVPYGIQIHHRDCDGLNNEKENLAVMTCIDHNWLHSEFGRATLFGYMKGQISLDLLLSWTQDPDRAKKLLLTNITNQSVDEILDMESELNERKHVHASLSDV